MDGYGPHSYGDAIADVYDEWYGSRAGVDDIIDALATLSRRSTTARTLELGIGSGRLALPLAARGVEIWGVDASPMMIERLRAKDGGRDIPVAICDMETFDLSAIDGDARTTFGLVFVAINTFFNLTSEDAQQRCLGRVRSVLAPDGHFVVEAFVPAVDRPTNVVEARTVAVDHVVLTATLHDPVSQTITSQFVEIRESGIRMRPVVIRYATPAQLDAMAARAGLRLVERWSDWTGMPFSDADGDGVHVSVYATQ